MKSRTSSSSTNNTTNSLTKDRRAKQVSITSEDKMFHLLRKGKKSNQSPTHMALTKSTLTLWSQARSTPKAYSKIKPR
jgi:hypothetical protein